MTHRDHLPTKIHPSIVRCPKCAMLEEKSNCDLCSGKGKVPFEEGLAYRRAAFTSLLFFRVEKDVRQRENRKQVFAIVEAARSLPHAEETPSILLPISQLVKEMV